MCSAQPKVREAIVKQAKQMGYKDAMNIDAYIAQKNKSRALQVLDLFVDDNSRDIYTDLMISRIQYKEPNPKYCTMTKQYFSLPQFLKRGKDFVFVDCGAFVGDSLSDFVNATCGTFRHAYEFEPDGKNFEALQNRVKRLNAEWALKPDCIICEKAGVGAVSTVSHIGGGDSSNLGASLQETGEEVKVFALNDYFKNTKVSAIKADIESYEYDMIQGGGA